MIDLRSDTVTRPTPDMLKAMMKAEVGDDVYKEDPTANRLEKKLAELFGKDCALFFASGSMANQAAIKLQTKPAEQLICDKWAHVYNFEGGGASFNSGVSCKLIDGKRGMITADQVEAAINPPDFYHSPLTSLVCLENTTNKGGGACYDLNEVKKIREACTRNGLGLHLDGARLFNALVAKGETPEEYGNLCDTISVCLSKGLGCPVGSVLLFDEDRRDEVMRIRKLLGGAMRQIGYLAAAGIYALDHNIERLADDHRRAKELAAILSQKRFVKSVEPAETNIVIFNLVDGTRESAFLQKMKENDILISAMGEGKLRIVTHLDYTDEQHRVLSDFLEGMEV